ncbi:MAG: TonB-dependent receptor [Mucilaginibacter polytrichastri]|nr:TonB-dependent receptor [Mucilaginibacter polytrichastri]
MSYFLRAVFTFLFLWSVLPVLAQNGSISGKATDASNQQPLEFASVILLGKSDGKQVKAAQTTADGTFTIGAVPDGAYTLRISYVGYTNLDKEVNVTGTRVDLGNLALSGGKQNVLKEVKVTGQKPDIELGIDKRTFSVEKSLVSQGGSATDLLANVPSIQVDMNGGINLRGSGNVRILINGKPSALSGGNVSDVLQSIPASAIQNIEVITNPSSKYDPEGQSGIINIILKKDVKQGVNGNIALTGGTLDTYNAAASLSYQKNAVNLYGNYSYRTGRRRGSGSTDRSNFQRLASGADTTFYFNQNERQGGSNGGHNIRTGIDVNVSPKTTLSFSDNLNFRNRRRFETGQNIGLNEFFETARQTTQDNDSRQTGFNYDLNLDLDHRFKRDNEFITANIAYSRGTEDRNEMLNTGNFSYVTGQEEFYRRLQQNAQDGAFRNWNLQLDYTRPLGKGGKLEAGFRTTLERNDDDFRVDTLNNAVYVPDLNLSNRFIYDQKVHALYTNYQQEFGKFTVQAGLRAEEAIIHTRLATTDERNRQNYFRVYPSLFLSQKLNEGQTLQLSYTRRVSRPRGRQLSPFLDRDDPLNLRVGNPNLLPEDTHSFEASYARIFEGLTLTTSVYHRLTNEIIQDIRTTDISGVSLTRYENLSSGSNSGFELIGKTRVAKKVDLTANINVYYRNIKGSSDLGFAANNGYAYNANLTTNFTIVKNFSAQLRGDYNGPQPVAQGTMKAFYGVDGALKYDFPDRKTSLSLNARDIFNTRRFGFTTSDATFVQVSQRRFQTRVVNLTLSFRFGSMDLGQKKRERRNNENEQGGDFDPSSDR